MTGRPEAENLVGIYAALADSKVEDVLKQFGGGQFSTFKNALADLAVAKIAPINDVMIRLKADEGYVEKVLIAGAERASVIAAPIMKETKKILGFV